MINSFSCDNYVLHIQVRVLGRLKSYKTDLTIVCFILNNYFLLFVICSFFIYIYNGVLMVTNVFLGDNEVLL